MILYNDDIIIIIIKWSWAIRHAVEYWHDDVEYCVAMRMKVKCRRGKLPQETELPFWEFSDDHFSSLRGCQLQERLSIHITLRWIWAQASLVVTSNSLNSEKQCSDFNLYYRDCTAAVAVDRGIAFTVYNLGNLTTFSHFDYSAQSFSLWRTECKLNEIPQFFLHKLCIVNISALPSPPLPMWYIHMIT